MLHSHLEGPGLSTIIFADLCAHSTLLALLLHCGRTGCCMVISAVCLPDDRFANDFCEICTLFLTLQICLSGVAQSSLRRLETFDGGGDLHATLTVSVLHVLSKCCESVDIRVNGELFRVELILSDPLSTCKYAPRFLFTLTESSGGW